MDSLQHAPSIDSLRNRVAAYERERAQLYRELAAPVRDLRLRMVQGAVLGLLTASFAFGVLDGTASSMRERRRDDRQYNQDKPLPVVQLPK